MALLISLNKTPVGSLGADASGYWFEFDQTYLELANRPILGRWFEELPPGPTVRLFDPRQLPSWFRNLLPEGAYGDLLRRMIPSHVDREFDLLRHVGEDLPGAVIAVDDELHPDRPVFDGERPVEVGRLRASLAGVQPKLSVLRNAKGISVPISGVGGDWIAKLPGQLDGLPENEFTMLSWATACGIETPQHELITVGAIDGIPEAFAVRGRDARALIVRRFDREVGEGDVTTRVHQEDFSQVLNLQPDEKYETDGIPEDVNYSTIGRIVRYVCGKEDFFRYIERLAFVVLSGNCDAHPKNWSLRYADTRTARLSPVYDQVCTIEYPGLGRDLALSLQRTTAIGEITLQHFGELALRADVGATEAIDRLDAFLVRARHSWREIREQSQVSATLRKTLDAHLAAVAI